MAKKKKIRTLRQARVAQTRLLSDAVRKVLSKKLDLPDQSHEGVAKFAAELLGIHLDGGLRRSRRLLCDLFSENRLDEVVELAAQKRSRETPGFELALKKKQPAS